MILILIAAAVALFAGIDFAAHYYTLGNVEVYNYPFPAEVEACDVYVIKFHEEFANSRAPETIETFYLPTLDVSVETADPGWVQVSDREKTFYPLLERTDFEALEAMYRTQNQISLASSPHNIYGYDSRALP